MFIGFKEKARLVCALLALAAGWSPTAFAQAPATPPPGWGAVSINLEEIPYPYPVQFLHRNLYGQDVRIAYMDVAPVGNANGQTVVLLHGSSYYGWYWEHSIKALSQAGFRVITIDRLGWGRSSKPIIPYDVSLHSSNTKAILDSLGISRAAIVGHSLGGRMASSFAYIYPEMVSHLVMVNPIALGDTDRGRAFREPGWGEPNPDLQTVYANNLRQEQNRVVEWKPEFLEHVRIRYGHSLSGEYHRLNLVRSMNSNLTAEPVDAFWPKIQAPALLIGGAQDGPNYPEAARRAAELLPNGRLHLFPNAGHNPHLDIPGDLNRELIAFIGDNS